MLGLADTK